MGKMVISTTFPHLFCLLLVYMNFAQQTRASTQSVGSCRFEPGSGDETENSLCGYMHGEADHDEFFHWELESGGNEHYMSVNTEEHMPGQKALLYSPEIQQQNTHCFSFQYHMEGGGSNQSTPSGVLNVFVLDIENSELEFPVWRSSAEVGNIGWTSVQLALTPNSYKVAFEAYVMQSLPGVIALDNTKVDNEACKSAPHFLRVSDKEANAGQNISVQCLLWGHSMIELDEDEDGETVVVMQKANGDQFDPYQRKIYDDHLGVIFRLDEVSPDSAGKYRCVSKSATEVGVSNFAKITVKIPPAPLHPPDATTQGSTHLKINLNSDQIIGDGPVIQTTLSYRPVSGLWSDVHEIPGSTYQLWHLQPDTEYEMKVTLIRPGVGGKGSPGPALRTKTSCGVPLRPVQNVELRPISSSEIQITWDVPDFSITQCHYHSYLIKYKQYTPDNSTDVVTRYDTKSVETGNIVRIPGLKPFTKYEIKVELANSKGSVETGDYTILTGEGVPGPVPAESFIVLDTDETSITVKWDEPKVKNGILTRYDVAFRGISSFQPDFTPQEEKGLFQVCAVEMNVTLDRLHPGTNYTLSIRAQTRGGAGPAVEITASTEIAPPKMGVYPAPGPDDGSVSTPTTIEIELQPAEANGGPISHYYIIVEEVPDIPNTNGKTGTGSDSGRNRSGSRSGKKRKKNKRREKRSNRDVQLRFRRQIIDSADSAGGPCHATPITIEEAKSQNKTFYFGGKLPPNDVEEGTKFVVGQGGDSGGFPNPPLDPNKKYNIYVRVDSNVGKDTRVNCVLVATKASIPPTTTTTVTTPSTTSTVATSGRIERKPTTSTYPVSPNHEVDNAEQSDDKKKVMMYASIGGGIVGLLLLALLIIFVAIRFRRQNKDKQKEEVVNAFEVHMMMSEMHSDTGHSMTRSADRQALMMPDVLGQNDIEYFDKSGEAAGGKVLGNYGASAMSDNEERQAIRVDDFHIHVNDMKRQTSAGFHDEFTSFHEGQTAPWDVGKRNENRTKNRYGNIMAYDHSRVVLMPPKGQEEEADYINANYIPGYKNPSMYIAAQAPAAETINDFWLMVWQEKCSVIVMVTNLVELGKRKCHKYWPDETGVYGTVNVSMTDSEVLCDYTIRTFVIQQADDYNVREVKQYHFTVWPDHGVPTHPTNILSFVRRIKSYEPSGDGPTIVHCSAGSGRTGCFIVVDMMLDMARDEGVVDIYNTVRDLRTRRVNMVQTEEQYIFIHESVLEALLCGDTLVSAPDLRQHYDALITVDQLTQIAPVQEEFETLNLMTPKLSDEECSVARLPRNRGRNRFMDVLPSDRQMPYLMTPHPMDPESNYINAVFTDSYSKSNAFLVTQMPLPNTVIDFWRLVNDYNCTSIIMMNDTTEHDQTCSDYWPDKGSAVFGPFTVELLRKEDEVDVVTRLFKMQNINRPSEGYRVIQQFQLTNWPATQPVPYTRNAMLRVIQLVTKWQTECAASGEGRMLVHCVAGAGRSGTFVACYNMCMQLRQEYAVDVFNIVQKLRNVRPQLVETLEQYRFCYEVGWDFADQ